MRKRLLKVLGSVVVTGLCVAYLVWKIDLGQTLDILRDTDLAYFFGAFFLMFIATWPMAWRWQRLLLAKGVDEPLGWLVRSYFVGWFVGQVLPTSLGGDASRIYQTSRRNPGRRGVAAGAVILERALGGAATLTLAAIGFVLAIGQHYDIGAYLWIEASFVVATIVLGFLLFSRSARRPLRRLRPLVAWTKLDKPIHAVYEAMHEYRHNVGLLVGVFALTLVVQAWRVLAIWLAGKAAGVDLSPRPYYVMGPLLFLVMLVPFTVNGLAVREAFFVSFLTKLGVSSDAAFATGFLFFLVTLLLAVPGLLIVSWDQVRGLRSPELQAPDEAVLPQPYADPEPLPAPEALSPHEVEAEGDDAHAQTADAGGPGPGPRGRRPG